MNKMDDDWRKDMSDKRLYEDASRALSAVMLNSSRALGRDGDALASAKRVCDQRAAHIVAVWD